MVILMFLLNKLSKSCSLPTTRTGNCRAIWKVAIVAGSILLFLTNSVYPVGLGKMEVTELPQNEMTPYVVSNSDEAILIVHSPIVGLWFESNNIIHKLDKPDTGEYILHLRPGTHVILFRAREFLVKRKQFYITKKTYQEVRVEVLDPPEDQSLSELSTSLKDSLSAEQTISEKQQEVIAADKVGGRNENSFSKKHQLGIRLGVWHHQGDSPPEPDQLILSTDTNFKTNLKQSAFNFEGYFAYRLLSWAMVELSVGSVNRGSVTINEGTATDVGNLILYPILAQFKIYPLGTVISGFQPFMLAGGGFYYGRRTVQFTNSSDYYPNWQEDTGADINYIIGGGIDWPMANVLSLDLTVKYMPIKFSEPLVAMQNYNAVAFSIGIKYLYLK